MSDQSSAAQVASGSTAHNDDMASGRPALKAWKSLEAHAAELRGQSILNLFAEDEGRFGAMNASTCGILLDYSKTKMTPDTMALLLALARDVDLEGRRTEMVTGAPINVTEKRSVLHTALRRMDRAPVTVGGRNVVEDVERVVTHMSGFVERVHSGAWAGYTEKRITDIVNIGIGGSDLGPRLLCDALKPYHTGGIRPHFVSNVDGVDIMDTLAGLDPETTLFIISSKSFTTQETMANARSARAWLVDRLGDQAAVAKHFVAVSTNLEAVKEFGIDPDNTFEFWDWVGGRYSLWSAIGLSIALTLGMAHFDALRRGAFSMDRHFMDTPLEQNLPVLLALVGIWHANFQHHRTLAVLPYSARLGLLPSYLQQADMESNGKSVTRDGEPVGYQTAPVLWGGVGTDVQHSFFQMLHQGTQVVPCEFIGVSEPDTGDEAHHRLLMANFFAQTEALMRGRTGAEARSLLTGGGEDPAQADALVPHTTFPGGRPSVTLLIDKLSPERMGALIALYEHKIFTQGVIWDVNSYDQFGVELGKKVAKRLLEDDGVSDMSASTRGLVEAYNGHCRDRDRI